MRSAALLVMALFIAAPLAAQAPELRPGVRVRLTQYGSNGTVVGEIVRLTADSMVVATSQGRASVSRPWITRLDVSTGRRRNVVGSLTAGVLGGGAVGAAVMVAGGDGGAAYLGAAGGGVAGGLAGLIWGVATRREHWVTASKPVALIPMVESNGRLGLSLHF
jgi:hypothetical protein